MSNKIVLWVVILTTGAGLLILANIFRDKKPGNIFQGTPTPSETVFLSPDSTSSPQASPSPRPRPTLNQAATTCQIKGEIVFLNKDTYENKGALIAYKNVDDVIRQIYWKADPNDGALTIGPNLFEDLTLPDGERNIGVALVKESKAENYTLTASITYGIKNSRGGVEEKIANCAGKVSVDVSKI